MSESVSGQPKTALVAGISGSGKSAIAKELRERGFASFDADEVPGLAHWKDTSGRDVERPKHPSANWLESNYWVWDSSRLDALLKTTPPPVFVCGSASNQLDVLDRFDVVILLELDHETMLQRLADSNRTNDFGASKGAREAIVGWLDGSQADLRKHGAVPIDASQPLPDVVDQIVEIACRPSAVREERLEIDGIPARLYDPGGARGLLLLGHGGGHSKDGPRFVNLARRYAEQTGLAVVCIDAVDHGERKPAVATPGIPPRWHSDNVDRMVADWRTAIEALTHIGPAVAYVGFSMGVIFGTPLVARVASIKAAVFVVGRLTQAS